MPETPFKILLIEDNPGDARLIREMLADAGGQGFAIEWVSSLPNGMNAWTRARSIWYCWTWVCRTARG